MHATALYEYCVQHSSAAPDYLVEAERDTHLKTLAPQMLSGALQGRLLALLSRLISPRVILEVGTFTGYSALCLAEGLVDDGVLHTIEINPECEKLIRDNWARSPFAHRLHLHLGDAQDIIPSLDHLFDLAFIDAAKEQYSAYYQLIIDRIRPGGVLLADNTLWGGKVISKDKDKETQAIRSFNKMVEEDPRVEQVLLPVRDGITVIRKR